MKTLALWLLATAVALLLACSPLLDGPDELDAAQAVAEDVVAAQHEAQSMHTAKLTVAMGSHP